MQYAEEAHLLPQSPAYHAIRTVTRRESPMVAGGSIGEPEEMLFWFRYVLRRASRDPHRKVRSQVSLSGFKVGGWL
jgi:hypothetical protein